MKNFLKGLQIGIGFFIITLSLTILSYIGIKARTSTNSTSDSDPLNMYVNTNEILKANKWNSMIDTTYYPKYAYKDRTGDFSTSSTSRTTDTAMNTDINVKKGDLILLIVNGNVVGNTTGKSTYIRPVLISGDGTMIDSNASNIGDIWNNTTSAGGIWTPFSLNSLIKANNDGTLSVGYQASVNGGTGIFRAVKVKAIVLGKTN